MIAAALAGMMVLTGCGSASAAQKETAVPSANPSAETTENTEGAWEVNNKLLSLDKNPEAKAAFERAIEGLDGYSYEAIALLGTQVVAGTNYSILVRGTAVTPDAKPVYQIITVYEDVTGKTEITDTKDLTEASEEGTTGALEVNDGEYDLNKNTDVQAVFDKALADLVGDSYEPVAYIGSQVVAGTTYYAIYRCVPAVQDPKDSFVLITATESPDGTVELGDITTIFPADDAMADADNSGEQIPAPFHIVDTLEDAEKETGIELLVPESINGSTAVEYQVYDEGMLEVLYEDADGNIIARVRKISGQQDNLSGDYNEYSVAKDVTSGDITVSVRGGNDKLYVAEWNANDASYALSVEDGMEESALLETVSSIQ